MKGSELIRGYNAQAAVDADGAFVRATHNLP